jgi:hypothetical protein
MHQSAVEVPPLGPLVGLVERLRAEVTELQGPWVALGEELEAKRRRLRLAEATVEVVQRRGKEAAREEEGEGPGGDGALYAEAEKAVSAQVRVGCTLGISQRRSPHMGAATGSCWVVRRRQAPMPTSHSTGRSQAGGPAPEPRHGAAAERVAGAPHAVAVRQGGSAPEGCVQGAEGACERVAHAAGEVVQT